MPEIIVEIINKRGLHARAAAKFVKIASVSAAPVKVMKLNSDEHEVGGSSILGLMMLGADPGSKLRITCNDAQALKSLQELVENKFGEGE